MEERKDVMSFIEDLDKANDFFKGVEEVNKFNMSAIVELIQYYNMKEFGNPIYTREEIRRGIKKYLTKE
ncbi:hypothetical protein SAMN05660297_01897 [Natronincola peptidivorans]|uniref:Uncharacterized protein n=1 Tax=Natronincola peptidivorans TaxID=426128 RepID=A0A1I0D867_9FIRM|nr:hypothetical protein [Natronincola peptidivorans]SET28083.1 hypothetical protein SAMN05660297_01897 [Natronincola peptidivorans]